MTLRYSERREFGPSLEWEQLPVLGANKRRPRIRNPIIITAMALALWGVIFAVAAIVLG